MVWVGQVLHFWFDELEPKAWFTKSDAVDHRIREQFAEIHEQVARTLSRDELAADAETSLAALVVLDQMPRNMFRGSPRMFETDGKALALAQRALDLGHDMKVAAAHRLFFYLPFEHSESLQDQQLSVALFEKLGDPNYLRYAIAHRDIIVRFGRFPHRNALLDRPSTPVEVEFLQHPGSSF